MKTVPYILLLSSFFLFPFLINAQESWHFAPNQTRFQEERRILPQMGGLGNSGYYEYLVHGDTTVDETSYQLVSTRNIGYLDYNSNTVIRDETPYILIGGVRKDAFATVYFQRFSDVPLSYYNNFLNDLPLGDELQLFDFQAGAGEPITWKEGTQPIEKIDSFTVSDGQTFHRQVFIEEPMFAIVNDYWINPIGGFRGLLGAQAPFESPPGPYYVTICIQYENKDAVYFEPQFSKCQDLLSSNPAIPLEESFQIYPNPSSGLVQLSYFHPTKALESIVIFDSVGRFIEEISIRRPSNKMEEEIYLSRQGIYLVAGKTQDGQFKYQKVVILEDKK